MKSPSRRISPDVVIGNGCVSVAEILAKRDVETSFGIEVMVGIKGSSEGIRGGGEL